VVSAVSPDGRLAATVERDGDVHRLALRDVGVYAIVLLGRAG
jgi:hypothetical protein